jgi:hypothetical protein
MAHKSARQRSLAAKDQVKTSGYCSTVPEFLGARKGVKQALILPVKKDGRCLR